jgi:hypothetical protein
MAVNIGDLGYPTRWSAFGSLPVESDDNGSDSSMPLQAMLDLAADHAARETGLPE